MHAIAMDTYPFDRRRRPEWLNDVGSQRQDPALSPSTGKANPRPRQFPGTPVVRQTTVKRAAIGCSCKH